MRLKLTAALCFGLVAFGLVSAPADAQTRRRAVVSDGAGTRYVETDESGRTRTKIVVQRRSFLDGGTEVLPGQRKFTDYVYPPGYSPTGVIDGTNAGGIRHPLPGPYDLPGKDNPYPWW
jgi:hypothetical protein